MSREYTLAADALREVQAGRGVRNAVYGACTGSDGVVWKGVGAVFGLVAQILANKNALETLIYRVSKLSECTDDEHLLKVYIWEFLSKGIKGGGSLKRQVEGRGDEIQKVAKSLSFAASTPKEKSSGPRFVRVNSILSSDDAVVAALTDASAESHLGAGEVARDTLISHLLALPADAHTRLKLHAHPTAEAGHIIMQDKASCFTVQALLGDLLSGEPVKPAEAPAAGGKGKAKDAAPVAIPDSRTALLRLVGKTVPIHGLDACAAPGNKTSQLASLLFDLVHKSSASKAAPAVGQKRHRGVISGGGESPREILVHAFEKDEARATLLKSRMEKYTRLGDKPHRRDLVSVQCADFLEVNPEVLPHVLLAVVDPSCSGSGMAAKGEKKRTGPADASCYQSPAAQSERINGLKEFQIRVVTHALAFPNIHRVAYSTCSLYVQEDEHVVAAVLYKFNHEQATQWQENGCRNPTGANIISMVKGVLPTWTRRGVAIPGVLSAEDAACCVRVDPLAADPVSEDESSMCGFFVAVFERREATPAEMKAALAAAPPTIPKVTDAPKVSKKKPVAEAAASIEAVKAAPPKPKAPKPATFKAPASKKPRLGSFKGIRVD